MDYIFTFRRLLAPVLIRIIYYIGSGLILIGGILEIFGVDRMAQAQDANVAEHYGTIYQYGFAVPHNPLLVAVGIPIALILWRVWCELWIVIFQIDDRLREIRDSLKSS